MLHCPVCNSTEIFLIVGGYVGKIYRCKNCGYQGSLVIEYEENSKDKPGHRKDQD